MHKTLLEFRHWLQRNNIPAESVHVTVALPRREDAFKAEMILKKSIRAEDGPVWTGKDHTYRLSGVDPTFASSERCLTDRVVHADDRIRELERENGDLRRRLDCVLLELKTHLTY